MAIKPRIAGLDGLRALAAGGVIAHHLRVPGSALGWTGVNLFFVLSGFLITGILLEDRGNPRFFSTFYTRRSLRIFPIYYLTLAVLIVASVWLGQSVSDWPYFVTYSQNWLYALSETWSRNGNNFSWGASHTWSLAIEEQFYLLWPLAIATLATTRSLLVLTAAVIIVGNISRIVIMGLTNKWWTGYVLLFSQMDMLAWGAAAAILYSENWMPREMLARFAKVAAGLGVLGLALVWTWKGANFFDFPGAVLSSRLGKVIFAALGPFYLSVLILAMSLGPFTRVLELRPLRYCGKISYGVYLYHWPVLFLVAGVLGYTFASGAIVLAITFLVAAASYRFIERPLLRLKDTLAPRLETPLESDLNNRISAAS